MFWMKGGNHKINAVQLRLMLNTKEKWVLDDDPTWIKTCWAFKSIALATAVNLCLFNTAFLSYISDRRSFFGSVLSNSFTALHETFLS